MTTPRTTDLVISRRTALAGLGAAGLGLILTAHGFDAFAQNATPTVTVSRVDHPFLGAWRWPEGPQSFFGVFDVDGTYVEYYRDLGMGIGGWRATGERTGQLFLLYQTFPRPVSRDEVFASDYVSAGHEFRPGVFLSRWPDVEVDEAGTTLTMGRTVKGTSEGRNPDGSLGIAFPDQGPNVAFRLVDAPTS